MVNFWSKLVSYLFVQHFVFVVTAMLIASIALIYIVLMLKNWQEERSQKIKNLLNDYIVSDTDNKIILEYELGKLLRNRIYRQVLIDEIVGIVPCLAQKGFNKVVELYCNLGLGKDSLNKVEQGNWFLVAKGIRELSTLQMKNRTETIIKHLDSKHNIVRLEAQNGILTMHGFKGLHLFRHLSMPISQWDQLCLVSTLSKQNSYHPSAILGLISADNHTLTLFALEIVRYFRLADMYKEVSLCLPHPNETIRLAALNTLSEIEMEDFVVNGEKKLEFEHVKTQNYNFGLLPDAGEIHFPEAAKVFQPVVFEVRKPKISIFSLIPTLLLYPRTTLQTKETFI